VTWDRYLERFHASRPGITEAVLRRSLQVGGGAVTDPYGWLAEAVPARGRVLDVGCGSAPLWKELTGRDYVGLDRSDAELAAARVAGAGPLLRASATAIPLRDASVDVVACSMSLMVFSPLLRVLPGLPEGRRRLAGAYLRLLARFGTELPVPLRRIVAVKPG
jgi:SAM-dependent methyltransferase